MQMLDSDNGILVDSMVEFQVPKIVQGDNGNL